MKVRISKIPKLKKGEQFIIHYDFSKAVIQNKLGYCSGEEYVFDKNLQKFIQAAYVKIVLQNMT